MNAEQTYPSWDTLFEIASMQEGLFTLAQADDAGFSRPLIQHHLKAGRIHRLHRGIYRLARYPHGEHEQLVALWLWSAHEGVFSHRTALALHNLCDVLPQQIDMILPMSWASRRLRVPAELCLHYANVTDAWWVGPIPVSSPSQTLLDCLDKHHSPELLIQALDEGQRRGVLEQHAINTVQTTLTTRGHL